MSIDRELDVLANELEFQCDIAVKSYVKLISYMQSQEEDNDIFWLYISSFLNATANISKILWGSNKKIYEKRKPLRETLNITSDMKIKERIFRNNFEHIDERIAKWSRISKNKNIVINGFFDLHMVQGIEPHEFIRIYQPSKHSLYFMGEDYEFEPILKELTEIRNKIKFLNAHHPSYFSRKSSEL
ncbi:hypothetical protein JEOAER750_01028 [Jeotgalicoccus aerolatus]|uniref:HEPN AbiU2-like domain-containing protein n=1 Tax=Jeotgalicoccus aerolatus TaxID=709510 RepID=A0ABS4HMQ2_9STAP|nr:hypothetical protein [Jeotgalicoccus aerolatus]MBP1951914.1 hypothetical protein [Jeotgalicoccus aerolatus]GGD93764.1 hypothetical protein GCM10007273_02620 [Jeotgalicoccus aerolatus]CAD2074874.1 hypothetical protein JEOAER750_01028 [Jeotgalicoccus aerolatus]